MTKFKELFEVVREYKIVISKKEYISIKGVKLSIGSSISIDDETNNVVTFFGEDKSELENLVRTLSTNNIKAKVVVL